MKRKIGVGIGTDYTRPGFNSRQGQTFLFSTVSKQVLGPIQPPTQCVPVDYFRLAQGSRQEELALLSPIYLHGIVLSWLSTDNITFVWTGRLESLKSLLTTVRHLVLIQAACVWTFHTNKAFTCVWQPDEHCVWREGTCLWNVNKFTCLLWQRHWNETLSNCDLPSAGLD
jgi:hypothetical protein